MSKVYKDVKAFSGATILGDGTVAMILDVQQLIQTAEKTADLEKLLN
jgi:two-component system chemotaxis sensor kinase CheA